MEKVLKFSKNVNNNPCHMCMPMGAILPFKGIEGSMVIIHGSQGCSTYMRRHIAEHYNEPIDVGSSSLNEKGTIYGGEKNLKQALDNVSKVYQPQLIGVLTSCLAETIGEDIVRIAAEYRENNPASPRLVPVPTPGYGGTHSEGYWLAVKNIIAQLAKPGAKHRKLNIVVPNISPADVREIKRILAMLEIEYVLCPDISSTLDRPIARPYTKIPAGGTKIADIEAMSGAPATIQFGLTAAEEHSPGHYLAEQFQVPLYNLPLPMGVENTDLFIMALSEITGKDIPASILEERGRLLDAMVDSHKYNYFGHCAIFGEPELVYAVTKTCLENGVSPKVVASGSKHTKLQSLLAPCFAGPEADTELIPEADFMQIRDLCVAKGVNIAIGHSDGRYLTEKADIPLVRLGFPIHDRVGGQRLLSVGYVGTALFMDRITNTLLECQQKTYRSTMYNQYYQTVRG
jgi:nitrogenase molybdenum-iron protein NifN